MGEALAAVTVSVQYVPPAERVERNRRLPTVSLHSISRWTSTGPKPWGISGAGGSPPPHLAAV